MTAGARDHGAAGASAAVAGHDGFKPIFVVGFPRSGTTMMAAMLSRHSRIAVPPETTFLDQVADGSRDRSRIFRRFATNRRCADLEIDLETLRSRFADRPATYDWLFRLALESYAAAQGKDVVAEKTPGHQLHVATLARWYPGARFIHVLRDGRDCVLSLMNVPWSHDNPIRHAAQWRRRMGLTRRLIETHGDVVHTVRYEQLVLNPEQELRRIMAFLGHEFEPGQLQPTAPGSAVPDWELRWKGNAYDAPDPNLVEKWKRDTDPESIRVMESVMGDELAAWGYEPVGGRIHRRAAMIGALYGSDLFRGLRLLFHRLRAKYRLRRRPRRR